MAILDDILNKNKNKDTNPVLAKNENFQNEQVQIPSLVNDQNKTETTPVNTQAEQSVALPEVKYPNKPQALNDGEYEYLLKNYSPEAITKFYTPFDPNSGENIFQRYYTSTMPKPSAPDEKKTRNRRIVAGIGDGVSMLAQMFNAGSGAHMRERNDSSLEKMHQQEQQEQNRYLQLSQRYNDGLFQARVKDFQQALDDYNNGRKGVQSVLDTKQKLDQAQAQFEDKQRFAYNKLVQDQANKERDYLLKKENTESQIAQRDAAVVQGWSRVADSRNRTTAYVKKMSSSGSGKNSNYQMIFAANPNDKNAQIDAFGNPVRIYDVTKGQIDQYARQALADPQFMAKHPYLIISKPKMAGEKYQEGSYKYKPNQDIAAVYIKEKSYDNLFDDSQVVGNNQLYHFGGGNPMWNDQALEEEENNEGWTWED